ncbi:hypothetical protein QBC33DRAFT_1306 [Phialemonium atrogriseum]|uniref:Uncharacterized protein n=1 Tax=Phialemonium atrogriseum TaxID=1093897 RepID=A0AAJ0FR94_9PEZI|nr:uncharacterized protein QBC33DRAFT_1306 [Phialemonium atrogriseum]KAK1772184.1 hypothetical protein QBC33DRAFT_1306 [Phialemonium atrogriseum]
MHQDAFRDRNTRFWLLFPLKESSARINARQLGIRHILASRSPSPRIPSESRTETPGGGARGRPPRTSCYWPIQIDIVPLAASDSGPHGNFSERCPLEHRCSGHGFFHQNRKEGTILRDSPSFESPMSGLVLLLGASSCISPQQSRHSSRVGMGVVVQASSPKLRFGYLSATVPFPPPRGLARSFVFFVERDYWGEHQIRTAF